MGQLTRLNTTNSIQRIQHEAVQRIDKIVQIRNVSKLAIREGTRLQKIVAQTFVTTVLTTQQEINNARRAGKMTAHKEQALYHYREAYKHELLSIVEGTHTKVYRLLERLK